MKPLVVLAALLLTLATLGSRGWADGVAPSPPPTPHNAAGRAAPLDSARDELRAGRFWHASRILRGQGVHEGDDPALLLLLAGAEAGWNDWPQVVRLLEGRPWLARVEGGEGLLLLARGLEEAERHGAAAEAFGAFLEAARPGDPRREAALVRRARSLLVDGSHAEALGALDRLPAEAAALRGWAALEGARKPASEGDTALVAALLARADGTEALEAAWRLPPRARLAAGDSAGALRAWVAAGAGRPPARRGEASSEAGRLALALGDSATARTLLVEGVSEGTTASRARAAAALLSFADTDPALTIRMAEALARAGDTGPALRAYDRAARLAGSAASLAEEIRLTRARLMATVPARHDEALEEFRAIRAATADPRIGARNLESWAELRRRQGRSAEVATLRRWLLEEHPASPEAAEVLWERGSGAQSEGRTEEALTLYATLARSAPAHNRAGEARMRTGQIHLGRGALEEAAVVYEEYLADFPEGRRWEEAAYWTARTRMALGDTAAAVRWVERIQREEPVSYYAVVGAELLGRPYAVAVPPAAPRPPSPLWLRQGMAELDRLVAAGLTEGANAVEARLIGAARGDTPVLLALAEELVARGRTVAAINLGWDLRREGVPWDRRLLEVVYPFPYREIVRREAAEWGLDPIMMAAIMRQESAFEAGIRSPAGAVGLMQVMPATGRELAGRHGPDGFREANLETAEVNLHLGAAFFRDMSRRYGGHLPLVLSAYNAGPARANRWRNYPEASDPLRFTERIPFDETRGYVKNVTRNLALYRHLYGGP